MLKLKPCGTLKVTVKCSIRYPRHSKKISFHRDTSYLCPVSQSKTLLGRVKIYSDAFRGNVSRHPLH